MMTNRFRYIGTEAGAMSIVGSDGLIPLFDTDGHSIVSENPYMDKGKFYANMVESFDRFSIDHFINNVELPSWMFIKGQHADGIGHCIDPDHAIFWYDSDVSVWITTSNNIVYHIFV